jgi:hypothetical protein
MPQYIVTRLSQYIGASPSNSQRAKYFQGAHRLAVIAHIRHQETKYDKLLVRGYGRNEARAEVEDAVDNILKKWEA